MAGCGFLGATVDSENKALSPPTLHLSSSRCRIGQRRQQSRTPEAGCCSGLLLWGLGQLEFVFDQFRTTFQEPVQDAGGFIFKDEFCHFAEVLLVGWGFEGEDNKAT